VRERVRERRDGAIAGGARPFQLGTLGARIVAAEGGRSRRALVIGRHAAQFNLDPGCGRLPTSWPGAGARLVPMPAEKTMNNLTLRTVSGADVDLLADVFAQCFRGPPWNEPWKAETAARRFALWTSAPAFRGMVATEGDRAVALAVGQIEGWLDGTLFFLQEMCVLPDRRGQGIGSHLLSHFLSQVKEADGVIGTYLLTDARSDAESFYTNRGFRRSDRKIVLSIGP
jgi:GNAT superfamily N-acetyltransferase